MMATSTLTRIDPLSLFDDVFRAMRTPLFESGNGRGPGFVPAVDVHRDDEDLVMRVDLPGVDPAKDVSVELSGRTLTVSGERRNERETEGGMREVRYGSFSRSLTLPADVGSEAVSADYDAGVLTVRVSGVYASEKPQRIQVAVGSKDGGDSAKQINA